MTIRAREQTNAVTAWSSLRLHARLTIIPLSVKNTPPDKNNLGIISFRSTKSGSGEPFLLLECRAKARQKGVFVSQTPASLISNCSETARRVDRVPFVASVGGERVDRTTNASPRAHRCLRVRSQYRSEARWSDPQIY